MRIGANINFLIRRINSCKSFFAVMSNVSDLAILVVAQPVLNSTVILVNFGDLELTSGQYFFRRYDFFE